MQYTLYNLDYIIFGVGANQHQIF